MGIVYRITAEQTKVYTKDLETCDRVCNAMINNGYTPKVKRKKKKDVPTEDIHLVD